MCTSNGKKKKNGKTVAPANRTEGFEAFKSRREGEKKRHMRQEANSKFPENISGGNVVRQGGGTFRNP